ncbi:MAG TPA: hypothetical protein VLR71_13510 [Casimicrobiaceae bacterium]|nr:hypothetical protein [Casimicrobiaceae bacterium]
MPNRRARPARVLRGRTSWCVVLVAALLNALTPVFAYAIGQPLHELAGGAPAGVRAVLAQDRAALHHAGMHAGHAGHVARVDRAHDDSRADSPHAVPAPEPAAAHCPYCLDFAAGAPLAPAVAVMPTAQAGHAPLPVAAPPQPAVRPSVRLAAPRGPPATA